MTVETRRDLDHRVLGGVCAGIATRYKYDVIGVRVVTVLLAVATVGLGGFAYLALWRFLPSASANSSASASANSSDSASASSSVSAAASSATAAAMSEDGAPSATARPQAAPALRLYGPIADDLPRVDAMIDSLADVESTWLRGMLEAVLSGSGKRLRPAVVLLAGRFGNYDLEKLVALAASVELLHTATLVHDDVIDGASERRGEPTAGALFGNAASVMLGDYMFAGAAEFVARTDNTRVVRNFAATLRAMANGELTQDISAFEYSEDVQQYLDRIAGKTASLFATAAEGGAIVAGAREEYVDPLRRYGESLGMAFQIIDDILDFSGDPEEMGKPVGSDLQAGTLTLPTILYMQRAPDDNPVKRAFNDEDAEQNFQRAIEEILDTDILEESHRAAQRFGDLAHQALRELPEGEARDALAGIVDYVLERRS